MRVRTRARRTLRLRGVTNLVRVAKPPIRFLAGQRANDIPIRGKVSFQVGDATIALHPDGRDNIASAIFWNGIDAFEAETLSTVAALARGIDSFIDIGANTGIYSVLVATLNARSRVYAFEPVVDIFHALHKNVQGNQLSNVLIFCEAVGDHVGAMGIEVPKTNLSFPTESSLRKDFRSNTYTQLTPCTTLERFVRDYDLDRIDLIKVDVEGFEYEVLKDAHHVLSHIRPMVICEVLHDVLDRRLEALLREEGYVFFHILGSGLHRRESLSGDETLTFLNYLFVPQEKLEVLRALGLTVVE